MASTSKVAGLVGLLGITAAVGAFFVGRMAPTERAERAEQRLARSLDEIGYHETALVSRAPSEVRRLRLVAQLGAMQAARALAANAMVRHVLAQPPFDAGELEKLEEEVDGSRDEPSASIYLLDRDGAIVAKREVAVAAEDQRPQIADASGKINLLSVERALGTGTEVSETLILPPNRAAQVTVVSVEGDALPIGAVVIVEDLVDRVTLDMNEVGGYLIYFDDRTVLDTGPQELQAALRSPRLDAARDEAKGVGHTVAPIEVDGGKRKFLAAIIRAPRAEGELSLRPYPPESVFILYAIDVFDPDEKH